MTKIKRRHWHKQGGRTIPDFLFDLRSAGEAFKDMKQKGLSGVAPLGEAKTKAAYSDYHNHKDEPPVAARQAEVARDYPKRAARINELNGHPPGSDGQMATALKRHNGGRVLVTTWRGPTSRTTTTMPSAPRACIGSASRRPGGTRRIAAWPVSSSTAPGTSSPTARRTAAPTAQRCRRTRAIRTATFSKTPREGGYSAA